MGDGIDSRALSVADQIASEIDEEDWFGDYVVTTRDPGPTLFAVTTVVMVLLYTSVVVVATFCGASKPPPPSSRRGKARRLKHDEEGTLGDDEMVERFASLINKGGTNAETHPLLAVGKAASQKAVGRDQDDPERSIHHPAAQRWVRSETQRPPLHWLPGPAGGGGRRSRTSSITGPPASLSPTAAAAGGRGERTDDNQDQPPPERQLPQINTSSSNNNIGAGITGPGAYGSVAGSVAVPRVHRGSVASTATSVEDVVDAEALAVFSSTSPDPRPTSAATLLRKVKVITNFCDDMTEGLLHLAGPFVMQALLNGGSEMVRMGLVGHLLGTSALSAYVIVDMLVRLTGDCVESILGAGNTLIAQLVDEDEVEDDDKDKDNAEGKVKGNNIVNPSNKGGGEEDSDDEMTPAGRQRRSGQYLQLSLLLYALAYIPIVVLWSTCMGRVLLFLGYTPSVAEMGRHFAVPYTLAYMVHGLGGGCQLMLDVVGYEVESTVMTGVSEVGATAVLGLVLWFTEDMTLLGLGCLYLAVDLVYLVGLWAVIHWKGWLEPYYDGLYFSSGGCTLFKPAAVRQVLTNSTALAFSYFVYHAEWQILTFFARYVHRIRSHRRRAPTRRTCAFSIVGSFLCFAFFMSFPTLCSSLGRAEVVAWGLLGTIWDVTELIATAVAEATEVRVAMYLGTGQPDAAKVVVYKSYWLGVVFASLISAFLMALCDKIPSWLTSDELLQGMLSSLLPMIALSNISLSLALLSWSVLYAQNRFRFSVVLSLIVTAAVTLPLAGLFSIGWNVNLQGQMSAVVIGMSVSGSVAFGKVVKSDWGAVSRAVITTHEVVDIDGGTGSSNDDDDDDEE
jgi:Na+-driven multidrug efflux pump